MLSENQMLRYYCHYSTKKCQSGVPWDLNMFGLCYCFFMEFTWEPKVLKHPRYLVIMLLKITIASISLGVTHWVAVCSEGAVEPRRASQPFTSTSAVVSLRGSKTRLRMEEEARKLLEEGISKKLLHPGRGELPASPNGTKVTNWSTAVRKLKRSLFPLFAFGDVAR